MTKVQHRIFRPSEVMMMQGVVGNYFPERGYGFIQGDDGQDYFFRRESVALDSRSRLDEGTAVQFVPKATSRGHRAEAVRGDDRPDTRRYELPAKVLLQRKETVPGWEILERGRWIASASSVDSPDAAWRALAERAAYLGANAVIQGEYWRTTGQTGNYQYSIHNVRGRLVVVGRRSSHGTYARTTPSRIEPRVQAERRSLQQYAKRMSQSMVRTRAFALKIGVIMGVAGGLVAVLGWDAKIGLGAVGAGVLLMTYRILGPSEVAPEDGGLTLSP